MVWKQQEVATAFECEGYTLKRQFRRVLCALRSPSAVVLLRAHPWDFLLTVTIILAEPTSYWRRSASGQYLSQKPDSYQIPIPHEPCRVAPHDVDQPHSPIG